MSHHSISLIDEVKLGISSPSLHTPSSFHTFQPPRLPLRHVSDWSWKMSLLLSVSFLHSLPVSLWLLTQNVRTWQKRKNTCVHARCQTCKLTVCCADYPETECISELALIPMQISYSEFKRMLCTSTLTHSMWTGPSVSTDGNTHTHLSHVLYGPYNPRKRHKNRLLELIYSLEP